MGSAFERKIKLNHLRLVSAIERHRQIGLAAEAMAITQPAASRMLVELEQLLGVTLFERHARGMVPTAYGQAMAERARCLLLNLSDLGNELQDLKQGVAGSVSVGAVTGAAVGVVIPAIAQLRTTVPNAEIQINVETSPILLRQLREGLCDMVLARMSDQIDPQAFEVVPAKDETVCLLVREGHPLAQASTVSLAELHHFEWVAQTHLIPIQQAVDSAFLDSGYPLPANVTSTTSLLVILAMLPSSDAIAPVASEVATLLTSDKLGAKLKVLALDRPIQVSPYYLITLKDRILSPLSQTFRSLIISQLETPT